MKRKFEGPLPGEIEEAKRNPDGWVYRIAGKFEEQTAFHEQWVEALRQR